MVTKYAIGTLGWVEIFIGKCVKDEKDVFTFIPSCDHDEVMR